ncbi:MAG: TRAP transporter small permease [Peptococcaceae bacterium]|nr:TRAP transporter small permease [Peptococcaceae bacterium]
MIKTVARGLERVAYPLSKMVNNIGVSILMFMMIVMVLDILLRLLFNKPILGLYELVEFMMVVTVFFGFSYTQIEKGHISVEMFVRKAPERVRTVIEAINHFVGMVLFLMICWGGLQQVKNVYLKGDVSAALSIPVWPFVIAVVIGSTLMSLVLLKDVLSCLDQALSGDKT